MNTSTNGGFYLNGTARPIAGGPIWGWIAGQPSTHGGSGTAGGEVTLAELQSNTVNHALAINVWGQKYLSHSGSGYVSPATHADGGYNDPSSGNYYNGPISNLVMGSRLGIPSSVTASSLGITSATGIALFNAVKTYGAYVVDNTAWDCLAINATPDAVSAISSSQSDVYKIFAAMKIVH